MTMTEPCTILDLDKPDIYLHQRCALIRFFEWNGARDPANLADEVIVRFLKTGPKIDSPPAYLQGIAQNVLMEYWRDRRREQTIASQLPREAVEPIMTEAMGQELNECLKRLSRTEATLIRGFYSYAEGHKAAHRKSLAKRYGLSENALRIRIGRVRKKVAACLKESVLAHDHEMFRRNSSPKC